MFNDASSNEDSTYYLNDGQPISSSHEVVTDEPNYREDVEVVTEERWVEMDSETNPVFEWVNDLVLGKRMERQTRDVTYTTITVYDSDGQIIDQTTTTEYGSWESTGAWERRNPKVYIAPSPKIDLLSIPLDRPHSQTGDARQEPQDQASQEPGSGADQPDSHGKRYHAEKQKDYSFHSAAKENAEDSFFYTKGVNLKGRDQFIADPQDSVFNTGDIILAPGVTKEMVLSAGFGWIDKANNITVDFYTLSPKQLKEAQLANKPGIVPTDYSFVVVKKLDAYDITPYYNKDGVYITRYSKLYTELSVYKLDSE